ncbi:hypothetical protein [Actinomadura sp. 21ATH]|uniref:hypothetical protein n=1 Tax=Actinomadura sp. 21ATH TaxID=1735444 RepID=UPI0035BF45FF
MSVSLALIVLLGAAGCGPRYATSRIEPYEALVSADGRSLTLFFGRGRDETVETRVAELPDQLIVTLRGRFRADVDVALDLLRDSVTVTLEAPLGGRPVRTEDGPPITVRKARS